MAATDEPRHGRDHEMTNTEARLIAEELLFREAFYLDHSDWTPWIQMYEVDAEYWLPAWRDEYETTADPNTEVSLIYHDSRRGLEERISRIESRKSVTALPLPRTVHQISNVLVHEATAELIHTTAAFTVHVYDARVAKQHSHFGFYEHTFVRNRSEWRIRRKKIILVNDRIPTILDFYSI
jgi:3-phenylpropionate/cinnamic acid dioxygenase small subunit